jgi:hypothetical protein
VIFSFGGIWDAGNFKGCAIHVMNMGIRHLTVPRRNRIEKPSLPVAFNFLQQEYTPSQAFYITSS